MDRWDAESPRGSSSCTVLYNAFAFVKRHFQLCRIYCNLSSLPQIQHVSCCSGLQRLVFSAMSTGLIVPTQNQQLLLLCVRTTIYIGTLPYYRIFQFNTLQPILQIAAYSSQPSQVRRLRHLIDRWRTRKLQELHFISIAVSPRCSVKSK